MFNVVAYNRVGRQLLFAAHPAQACSWQDPSLCVRSAIRIKLNLCSERDDLCHDQTIKFNWTEPLGDACSSPRSFPAIVGQPCVKHSWNIILLGMFKPACHTFIKLPHGVYGCLSNLRRAPETKSRFHSFFKFKSFEICLTCTFFPSVTTNN